MFKGARGGAVSWGTAPQAGRSRVRFPMVSLEFFFWHNPSGRTMAPGVGSAPNRNEYQEYFLGVKAAGVWSWQLYHLHMPIVLKSGSLNLLELSGPVQGFLLNCINNEFYATKDEWHAAVWKLTWWKYKFAGSSNWVCGNTVTAAEYHVCATMFDLRGNTITNYPNTALFLVLTSTLAHFGTF